MARMFMARMPRSANPRSTSSVSMRSPVWTGVRWFMRARLYLLPTSNSQFPIVQLRRLWEVEVGIGGWGLFHPQRLHRIQVRGSPGRDQRRGDRAHREHADGG